MHPLRITEKNKTNVEYFLHYLATYLIVCYYIYLMTIYPLTRNMSVNIHKY